jgi:hypothetical protein
VQLFDFTRRACAYEVLFSGPLPAGSGMNLDAVGVLARAITVRAPCRPLIVVKALSFQEVVDYGGGEIVTGLSGFFLVAIPAHQEFAIACASFSFNCENFVDDVKFCPLAFSSMHLASVDIKKDFIAAGVGAFKLCDRLAFLLCGCRDVALFANVHKLSLPHVDAHVGIGL